MFIHLAVLLCTLSAFTAQGQTPDAILALVDAHYNHLSSLTTRYTEHYAGVGLDRTESGTLTLKKPGRMRWAYDTPVGKLFILDGHFAWFYTPGDAQAQRIPAKQMDDLRSPLRFLLGHTELKKELDKINVTSEPSGFRIAGVPRGLENRVRELVLHVTSTGLIASMRLEELDGAVIEFTFSGPKENLPIPDSTFTFTPPPGVAVVNGAAPI